MTEVVQVTRYHPGLVALHWLVAILVIGTLGIGVIGLRTLPNDDSNKIALLAAHMAVGAAILALMALSFVVRVKTSKPPLAQSGHALLDRLALVTHYGFYVLVVLMVTTGFVTAIASGINQIVFGGYRAPLPADLVNYPSFVAHFYLADVLAGLIALHIAGALYHQCIIKDGLLRRMSVGRRHVSPPSVIDRER
jgi:cytochrome b561